MKTDTEIVKPKKRSFFKTFFIKFFILLVASIALVTTIYLTYTVMFIKPGYESLNHGDFLSKLVIYDKAGNFNKQYGGIVALAGFGGSCLLMLIATIIYKKIHFKIGKKSSFVWVFVPLFMLMLLMFVVGMLSKPNLLNDLTGFQWYSLLWQFKTVAGSIYQPSIAYWIIFSIGAILVLISVISFVVFLIKCLFARSYDKKE